MRISRFDGIDQASSPQGLRPTQFQVDEGSNRYKQGLWRRRKGLARTNITKSSSAVKGIMGFELLGQGHAYIVVEGTNITGYTNVQDVI